MRTLQELQAAVRMPDTGEQFAEAVRAYNAGAFRSATIALWIATVHDLLSKIGMLADGGDKAAIALVTRVKDLRERKQVHDLLVVEREIIDTALSDFQLLDATQADQLLRLREDRNACAHPTYLADEDVHQVSEEQVRAYLVLTVDAVLSQPTVIGRALIDKFTSDTKSRSWPDENLVEFVRERYFDRARDSARSGILKVAVKAALTPPGGDNVAAGRCLQTLRAVATFDEEALRDAILAVMNQRRVSLDDATLRRALGVLGWRPETWQALGASNVARCRQMLLTNDVAEFVESRGFASGVPAHPDLVAPYQAALRKLDPEQLVHLTERQHHESDQFIQPTIERLRRSSSWAEGGHLMQAIVNVGGRLRLEDVQAVADAFRSNHQIHQSWDVPRLVQPLVYRTAEIRGSRAVWEEMYNAHYDKSYAQFKDTVGFQRYKGIATALGIPQVPPAKAEPLDDATD